MKNVKSEKGLTMISLIVTIIVLGILAAISIKMIGGDDGIIQRAKKTKEQVRLAESNEATDVSKFNETVETYNTKEKDEANASINPEGSEIGFSPVGEVSDTFNNILQTSKGIKSYSVKISDSMIRGNVDVIVQKDSDYFVAKNTFQMQGSDNYANNLNIFSTDPIKVPLLEKTSLNDDYVVGKNMFDKTLKGLNDFKVIEYSLSENTQTMDVVTSAVVNYNDVYYKVKQHLAQDNSQGLLNVYGEVTKASSNEISASSISIYDKYNMYTNLN